MTNKTNKTNKPTDTAIIDEIISHVNSIPNHNPLQYVINIPPPEFTPNTDLKTDRMFDRPDHNELQELAVDQYGNDRELTKEQFRQLRAEGKITVPSKRFPGQNHVWQTSSLLQVGTMVAITQLGDGIATGVRYYVERIPKIFGTLNTDDTARFTFLRGVRSVGRFCWDIPNMLVGMPLRDTTHSKTGVIAELDKYRVKYLFDRIVEQTTDDDGFIHVYYDGGKDSVKIPMRFVVDKNSESFRTLRNEWNKHLTIWNNNAAIRRDNLIRQYSNMAVDTEHEALLQTVADKEAEMLQETMFEMIGEILPEKEATMIIDLIKTIRIIRQELYIREMEKQNDVRQYMTQLKMDNPIRARISYWLNKKQTEYSEQWENIHKLEDFIGTITDKLTDKFIYGKNMQILSLEDYKHYQRRLTNQTRPAKEFEWKFRIWNPKNWEVTKNGNYYSVDKYNTCKTTTNMPFWRLSNLVMGAASLCWNGMYYCGKNLVYGPLGLRSIFGVDDFVSSYEIDHHTGELREGIKTSTWIGNLLGLWGSISESRQRFEQTADNGILGKGFSRFFNRLWNYGVKGFLGTVLVGVGHPLLMVLNTIASGVLFGSAPVWSTAVQLCRYVFNMFVWDLDGPSEHCDKLFPIVQSLGRLLFGGIGRLCLTGGVMAVYSLMGFLKIMWATVCYMSRSLYDGFIFHTILRFRAHVPRGDTFGARRISGPDMGRTYYHKIDPDLTFMLVQYEMEKAFVGLYSESIKRDIMAPTGEVVAYLDQFKRAGLRVDETSEVVARFTQVRNRLLEVLNQRVRDYHQHHMLNGRVSLHMSRDKLRLSGEDLSNAIRGGEALCKAYYERKLRPYIVNEEYFWNNLKLTPNNWNGMFTQYLVNIFGEGIMEPIEDVDKNGFVLGVKHVDFTSAYRTILHNSLSGQSVSVGDDLDDDDDETFHLDLTAARRVYVRPYNGTLPKPTFVVVSPQDMFSTDVSDPEKYAFLAYKNTDEITLCHEVKPTSVVSSDKSDKPDKSGVVTELNTGLTVELTPELSTELTVGSNIQSLGTTGPIMIVVESDSDNDNDGSEDD